MVFHKDPRVTHPFFKNRSDVMNRAIEPSIPRLTGFARGHEAVRLPRLVAQWQTGPQTLAGSEQCKLRLSFVQLSDDSSAAPRL